jgi:hypothetical protein
MRSSGLGRKSRRLRLCSVFPICGQSIGSEIRQTFSLSHGALQLAAEQVLAEIGTFEAEKAAKR